MLTHDIHSVITFVVSHYLCPKQSISNAGLRHLSSLTSLEVLNLDSRDIGDDGLKYLKHLPLKSLDLFSGRVTDLGQATNMIV